jgi:CheY-like chemotaxis protein
MIGRKSIVLVGHCGPDAAMLRSLVGRVAPDVPLVAADDAESLDPLVNPGCVLLINRVLDWGFETTNGIELIQGLAARSDAPVMLLVSNYEEAQREAVEAGAMPGFGKSRLYEPETAERLRAAVERAAAQAGDEEPTPARG